MNLQRREEIRGLIAEITRYEELGATLDLESKARDAITELLAHIDTMEQAAAERVIADGGRGPTPDYTGEGSAWRPPNPVTDAALVEVRSWIHTVGPVGAMVWVDPQEALKVAGIRVLGEGMVAMNAIKRKCQNDDEDAIEALTFCGYGEQAELLEAAIRANQGGASA